MFKYVVIGMVLAVATQIYLRSGGEESFIVERQKFTSTFQYKGAAEAYRLIKTTDVLFKFQPFMYVRRVPNCFVV